MSIEYQLELFIEGHSAKGEIAERNLRRMCEARLAGRYALRVTDVLEAAEAAEEANIVATPALVRRAPLPVRVLIGDLSVAPALAYGLGLEVDFSEGTND